MKKLVLLILVTIFSIQLNAQLVARLPQKQVQPVIEKIKISFPQSPTLHNNGGWEKGPSNWMVTTKAALDVRAGLLVLDRKQNGMVRYVTVEIRFKESGAVTLSVNSMEDTFPGQNGWQIISGKKSETLKATFIIKEPDFGTQAILMIKDFKPYKQVIIH